MKKVEEEVVVQEVVNKPSVQEDQNNALNVLVQAIRLAQKRGAFELEETEVILKAVKVFSVK